MTGIGGEFQFDGLAEGQYRVSVEKPEFNAAMPGSPITIQSSITDLRLKLSPLGVIEGKVIDQYGEPIRHVKVMALRLRINDGRRTILTDRSVATDDLGAYRLWNLSPGKYYIEAGGRSGGTYTYVGDNGPTYDSWESFAPVYAGGARDINSATPVEIAAGTQAQADINVTLEPAFKIRGMLGNFIPHLTAKFELLRGEEDLAESRVTLNGTTGKFEIQDVTPGTYNLRVTQNENARAEAIITVNGADVNDLGLPLAPGVTVTAALNVTGQQVAPQAGGAFEGGGDFIAGGVAAFCNLNLMPAGRGSEQPKFLAVRGDGEFKLENVLAGEYQVGLRCFGGYATSATMGSADLLTNPRLILQPGVTPPKITVAVTGGGATLKGRLKLDPPAEHAAILLVPAFPSAGPILQPVFEMPGQTPANEGQAFQVMFLAPGDYTLYAFSDWQDVEFRNPAYLQTLSGGTSVHIDQTGGPEVTVTGVVK
jgi:uncharacterized protein (DUF2141 family)